RDLLAAGADVNARTKETPPFRHHLLEITGSLEWGAFTGQTPFLTPASAGGHAQLVEAVKLCVDLGMDVTQANSMGITALHGAANRGSDDIIRFLVARGADLTAQDSEHRSTLD